MSTPLDKLGVPPPPRYSKPGPYTTELLPGQELAFQDWTRKHQAPWQDTPEADYDMRGYWRAQQQGDLSARQQLSGYDKTMHFPDTYKTPYHRTFSNESKYATADAPHWEGDKLVSVGGRLVADETPPRRKPSVHYPGPK